MRRPVVITDLTRMGGQRVCLAGYTYEDETPGFCLRPELPFAAHLTEGWLTSRDAIVRPFAVAEFDLIEHRPHPPHTEDWIIDRRYRLLKRLIPESQRLELLRLILDDGVASIFGAGIHQDTYVTSGTGTRSLGTVRSDRVWEVFFTERPDYGRWDYRIAFRDAAGMRYKLPVTDLAFRYFLDFKRDVERQHPRAAAGEVTAALQRSQEVFFRVGLARGHPSYPDRCYLQINAVYSFPDYLGGACFLDFAPRRLPDELPDVPF